MSIFLIAKALHLIGMVAWFAGLFYLVRLFVYHVAANDKPETIRQALHDQFQVMEIKLFYIITWPGMVVTLVAGLSMLHTYPIKGQAWLHAKLLLVFFLVLYHFYCGHIRKKLIQNPRAFSEKHLRVLNEVPTLLLVGIVFLAVTKHVGMLPNVYVGLIGFFAVVGGILWGIKRYPKTQ